jgi:PAS domain S-box-containing protein
MLPDLFEIVPDALIVVDGGGRIVQANANAERLFGYPRGALPGLEVETLMPVGVRRRHQQHRADYMEAPRVRPMGDTGQALIGQRWDGQQFPVEIALSPIDTGEGTHYLASIRDVSESQRVRQALVRARYDALVAHIGQLALESFHEGNLVRALPPLLSQALHVDAAAVGFLRPDREGIEVQAAVGFDETWLESLSGENWPMVRQALAEGRPIVLDEASRRGLPLLREGVGGACAIVPLLDRGSPMGALIAFSRERRGFDHDAQHLLQSVANLLAAMMQRRHTEEQLAHSQRLDAIGQLTGGVAHDFNNLLTVLSGNLQLLEEECGRHPGAAALIASALRAVGRGAELTSKLLAFGRRQHLAPRAVEPQALLGEIGTLLERTLGDTIRLKVECADSIPPAFVDPTQLDTALVNLVLNARDAMPRGGEITLAACERWVTSAEAHGELGQGHYVVFRIDDTGHGMTPETLARAMEPFYTTKDVGRGSGLGLSMVYGFVRQSGGYMHIDSRLGYGTSVELYFPAARRDHPTVPTERAGVVHGEGETVLVVEDEPQVRAVAVAFLQSLGYRTCAVGSAAEALERLGSDPDIALLFSDVKLGNGMDGSELAEAARRLRPGLAVLMTTGYDDKVSAQGHSRDVLRKPYRREQLAASIQRCLEPGRSRAVNAAPAPSTAAPAGPPDPRSGFHGDRR